MYSKNQSFFHGAVTILVVSLDFDGCTDTPDSRDSLIDYIDKICELNPNYNKIVVLIGSLRQSLISDLGNAIYNSRSFNGNLLSCTILLTDFVTKLQCKLTQRNAKIKVVAEKLLAADVYNNLPPGTTFNLITSADYKELYRPNIHCDMPIVDKNNRSILELDQEEFEEWYKENVECLEDQDKYKFLQSWGVSVSDFDDFVANKLDEYDINLSSSDKCGDIAQLIEQQKKLLVAHGYNFYFDDIKKCLTLYVFLHHLANKHMSRFDMLHFDDREDILSVIDKYYREHDNLIPNTATLKGVQWDSRQKEAVSKKIIIGNGNINSKYAENTKNVAIHCADKNLCPTKYLHEYFSEVICKPKVFAPIAKQASTEDKNYQRVLSSLARLDKVDICEPNFNYTT